MAKINKEQVQRINDKCSNDWIVDTIHLVSFGEKQLLKRLSTDNKGFLEFTIYYNSDNQILLRISKFEYINGCDSLAVNNGVSKCKILDETKSKRKSVDKLVNFTNILTDKKLLEINSNTEAPIITGLILE